MSDDLQLGAQRASFKRNWLHPNDHLSLFDHGLVVVTSKGTHTFDWATVQLYKRPVGPISTTAGPVAANHYVLAEPSGATCELSRGFRGLRQWAPAIEKAVIDAQFPSAWAAITSGEARIFGPITLSKSTLSATGKSVAWPDIKEIAKVQGGTLAVRTVTTGARQLTVRLKDIPNVCLLLALARRLAPHARIASPVTQMVVIR